MSCVFLLGAAASLFAAGLYMAVSDMFDVSYSRQIRTTHFLPIAIAFCTSLGIIAPRLMNRRPIPIAGGGWTHVAMLGLACGVGTAIFPFILTSVHVFSAWVHSQFMLSDLPLRFIQFGVMLVTCLPFAGIGLTGILLTKSLRNADALLIRDFLILLGGLVAGSILASLLEARPALLLPAASLPLLVFAVIAGGLSNAASGNTAGLVVQLRPIEDR